MADQDTPTTGAQTTGEAEVLSDFVVVHHDDLDADAVVPRSALDVMGEAWKYVRDSGSPALTGPLGPIPPVQPEPVPEPEPFDPSAHTVEEVRAYIEGADDDERQRVLTAERSGKSRTTLLDGQES